MASIIESTRSLQSSGTNKSRLNRRHVNPSLNGKSSRVEPNQRRHHEHPQQTTPGKHCPQETRSGAAMTDDHFNALTDKLEAQARQHPHSYQVRVLLLALLGNAYLATSLLFSAALFIASLASALVLKALAIELIVVAAFFLWVLVKALWIEIPPPEGMPVTADQAPKLFAMIAELRRQLGAPPFHHVLITDDFNAAVVQAPRLGIFGWHRNYFLIGLPLMKGLTAEQFKAVLAHELGHLAHGHGHGRVSNWIYCRRLRWSRLLAVLEENRSKGGFLFKPFLNWFAPYFNAYSFPLARDNEYQADATSARLTSSRAAAEALTSVNIVGSYLNECFWPRLHKQADELPQPGFAPYASMGHQVAASLDNTSTKVWLNQALARRTTSDDTHPALADRLKAIGETPRLCLPASGWGADRLLGDALASITERFDRRWQDNILHAWEERHRTVQEERRRLAELDARHDHGIELSLQDACDRARLTESVGGDAAAALAQFRVLHERAPADPAVCFGLGMRLLARDDDTGCALIEHAMERDEELVFSGCEALRDHCWHRGQADQAHVWHRRLVERVQLQDAAAAERNQLLSREKLDRHGLPEHVIATLRAQLQTIPGLRKAYLVKKRVKYLPHRPCYVFGFTAAGVFRPYNQRRAATVLAEIQKSVQFPGETLMLNVEGDNSRFRWKFYWMRGARIL
jgi:Zn-dependent protease with chaperone function